MSPKLRIPTDEEEAAIQRGIAADPDNPELTRTDFQDMRPAREVMPAFLAEHERRTRGPQKRPTKTLVSLRLDPEVVDALKATGRGWQVRAGDILRRAMLAK